MYPSLCVLNALLDSVETAANMMRECVRGYAEKISRRAERRRGIEGWRTAPMHLSRRLHSAVLQYTR